MAWEHGRSLSKWGVKGGAGTTCLYLHTPSFLPRLWGILWHQPQHLLTRRRPGLSRHVGYMRCSLGTLSTSSSYIISASQFWGESLWNPWDNSPLCWMPWGPYPQPFPPAAPAIPVPDRSRMCVHVFVCMCVCVRQRGTLMDAGKTALTSIPHTSHLSSFGFYNPFSTREPEGFI